MHILTIIQAILLLAKIFGIISLSWWLVWIPLYIVMALYLVSFFLVLGVGYGYHKQNKDK